jgi:hypothetical protein
MHLFPYLLTQFFNITAKEQLNKISVGAMLRTLISLGTSKEVKNIQMELVCMRAVSVDPARDENTSTSTGGPSMTSTGPSTGPTSTELENIY